jgi:riboflavin kinase/FMN adenylyltransferase
VTTPLPSCASWSVWQADRVSSESVTRFDDLADLPSDWPASVVTIGVFDGVHLGHRELIAAACHESRRREDAEGGSATRVPVVAVTFDPHPNEVVREGTHPAMLATVDHRVQLLHDAGADAVVVLPFTREFAALTPEEFAGQVLAQRLHAVAVVVGANFRFGHRASGTTSTLAELGMTLGFSVVVVDLARGPVGGGDVAWSSTYVRQCVMEGDVEEAAAVLGRHHRVTGEVVHGDHRGRQLGFPTANLALADHAAVPADGVYAGWVVRPAAGPAAQRLPAAISIGTNPTFDGEDRRVEAYVLDRDDLDLYGELIAVEFQTRLRATLRFDSVDALVAQMNDDVARARSLTS